MNNEITSITTFTGQGDTFPSRYSSPSAGKREGIMKHTQGKIETFKKTNGSIQIDYNGAYIGSLRPPPSSGWFKEDEIDTEKIANLIAAAPEMLSLLKRFLEAPAYKEARDNTKWTLLDEMIAVTTKAEGE